MEFKKFATTNQVLTKLPTMTKLECCQCAYHGYGIHIRLVADRLLEVAGSKKDAMASFTEYLKTHYPTFEVRGKGTKAGEELYEPQRLYNKLYHHYRNIP